MSVPQLPLALRYPPDQRLESFIAAPPGAIAQLWVLAGGQLFGFLGMLLALPMAAVANVLLRYAHERYTQSHLYAGERPSILLDTYLDKDVLADPPSQDAGPK